MSAHTVLFLPGNISVPVPEGTTVLQAQILAGLRPDAPCGGKGTCGKCRVIVDGQSIPACQYVVTRDLTVQSLEEAPLRILSESVLSSVTPDAAAQYCLAFDIGTTTVVAYLMDGHTGSLLARSSAANPQYPYGADVISRLQYALKEGCEPLSSCIRNTMQELTAQVCIQAGISPADIGTAAVAGNTAMHHLLLNINPQTLVTPPYMPSVYEGLKWNNARILPNIAGFVGGDTVACMVASRFDRLEELSLLLDIGTNGEIVLGNRHRRIACSAAAGPAFEGARISCGMRGAPGAVDHVWLENGSIQYHVIGGIAPAGLCGSGLLDLVAVLLDTGIIDRSGRMKGKQYTLCDNVTLTQKDIREVQLAKAAICAGIELLTKKMGTEVSAVRQVYLAGAFGNYLTPASACRIGMIPPELLDRIVPVGNAAGAGTIACALSAEMYSLSGRLARETEFLELAGLPQFQRRYIDALNFP